MPLHVSCLGPVLRLACFGGGQPSLVPPCPVSSGVPPLGHPTARALASWLCVLWGRHEGTRGGGAPAACVWGVRGWALSQPPPLVLWGVRLGPTTHWLWVRGMWARGPVTKPTARAPASWLCALWGRHEGAQGGRLLPVCGASGVRRSPTPDRSSFGACCRGPLHTGCGCRGCRRGDPSPTPQCALLRPGFARCGGGTRAPGGGASRLGVGRPGSGALPTPTARPLGRAARVHYQLAVGADGAGVGTRQQPHRTRSCDLALRVLGAARGRPGGAPCLGVGRPGSGALPPLDRPSFGACSWGPLPTGCGCGGCGVGTRHQPHSARSCELALRAVGATRGRTGGGAPLAWA